MVLSTLLRMLSYIFGRSLEGDMSARVRQVGKTGEEMKTSIHLNTSIFQSSCSNRRYYIHPIVKVCCEFGTR